MIIDWDNYRRMDLTFKFSPMLRDNFYLTEAELSKVVRFLDEVCSIQPINSRQAAAVALVQAFVAAGVIMQFKQKGTL